MSRGSYRRLLPKIPPSCKISHIAALNVLNTSHSQTTPAGSTTVTADELERRSLGSRGEVEGSSSHGSPSTSIVHSPAEESDLVITGQRAEDAVAEWLRGTPHRRSDSWACTSVKQDGVGVGGGRRDVLGVGQATSKPSDLWRNSALRRSTQLEHWAGRYHPVANNNNNNMSGVLTSPGGDCGDSSGDIDSIPISLPDPNSNLRLSPGGGRPRSGISPGGESARGSVATVQPDLSNNGGVQPPASYSNLLHELVTAKRQVVLLQQLVSYQHIDNNSQMLAVYSEFVLSLLTNCFLLNFFLFLPNITELFKHYQVTKLYDNTRSEFLFLFERNNSVRS